MNAYVEHANITVKDLDATVKFLSTAIPEFQVRHQGFNTKRWCHIGTQQSYIAVQEVEPKPQQHVSRTPYFDLGVNHVGLVVEDVAQIEQRLTAAGYRKNMYEDEGYRKRLYFFDGDGLEWEFIEYLTTNLEERNRYGH